MAKFVTFKPEDGRELSPSELANFRHRIKKAVRKNKKNRAKTVVNTLNNPIKLD
jgi:hypothetical protein